MDTLYFNKKWVIIGIVLLVSIISFELVSKSISKMPPTPTEFVIRKEKRKELKKHRKAWMENMHRSHSDDDWKSMDAETRKKNTSDVRQKRANLVSQGRKIELKNNHEVILNRDIEGVWEERGSNNLAGRIRTADIDFENEIIYCASSGGNIWKGNIDGENWQSLNDYMQIKGITFLRLVDVGNTHRLLIGSKNGFYYTVDEGLTLHESAGLNFLSNSSGMRRAVMQFETNHIYLLLNEWGGRAIYRSTNFGESFEYVLSLDASQGLPSENISHFDIFTTRYSQDAVYLINDMSFYKIVNDNIEWIADLPGNYSDSVLLTGGNGVSGNFFYAHVGNRIFRSINNGNTWADRGNSPSDWWFTVNSFNASNLERDRIFIGGMELFGSSNGANNWSLVNAWYDYYNNMEGKLHADIPEIRLFLDEEYNEIALISTDGGLYVSEDNLNTVHNLSLYGLGVSQYYSTYSQRYEPYAIIAGSQDQGLQRSLVDNGGIRDFEQIISGDYGHLVSGDDGHSIWTNYPGFTIYYSNIEHSDWGISLDFPGNGHMWLAPLMEHPYSAQKAILGGGGLNGGNHLIELSIQGNQITYDEQDYNFSGTISAMEYSPIDPSYRYVLTENGKFYYSSDDGSTWLLTSNFTGPTPQYFYGSTIWASTQELGKVTIGGSGYSNSPVYVSANHGQSFSAMNEGLPNTLVYQLYGTPNDELLFAATEVGPYVYSQNNEEWLLLSGISAPDQTYWTVDFIPELNTARFATYGRGIWDFILEDGYEIIMGDVNGDENVNIQDVIIMVNFVINGWIPTDEQMQSADHNEDGEIDILDIIMTVNIILSR